MKPLKIGITGVRGIVGQTFTPELVVQFAQAFGSYLDGGRILICRDTRPSGPMIRSAVIAGLLASGCEVIDLGVSPTPSMQLAVKWLNADGGIAITAGHNPAAWNALKFVRSDGVYLNPTQAEELLDIYHQGEFLKANWQTIKQTVQYKDAIPHHIEVLNKAFGLEHAKLNKLVVAIDCCNGACSLMTTKWLEGVGCEVLAVNDDPTGVFPHEPEPKAETMAQLSAVVKAGRADIGFAQDADGERLGIVTEKGERLSEETTLALASLIRLKDTTGTIVTNISTTGAIDIIAERFGGTVVRTPVGQAYISEAMIEHGAMLGGEGSGGVTVPEVQLSHDSAAAIGLMLSHLSRTGKRVSELVQELPRLAVLKHNIAVEPNHLYSILQDFRTTVERENLQYDTIDGLKVKMPNGWVHVRASNTESIIRIIVESENAAEAPHLLDWVRDRLTT
ncbi:MAG TPA: phosphoglucosamine mutase [Pyrinomonadaceae bacterium]|nr:phosphoglucosamine mutase [Pyrinomonadaceae bacterium]